MNAKITLAIEVFEHACDDAIEEIGAANAQILFTARRERAGIIEKLAPKDKYGAALAYQENMKVRGVSEKEIAAKQELFRQEFEKATAQPDEEWTPTG